jgi:spatacsin
LEKPEALRLMAQKGFPFALTLAVAYDMDTEANWAEVMWETAIVRNGEQFLNAFQYFRPITANLCDGVVRRFRAAGGRDPQQRERMKKFLDEIENLVDQYRFAQALEFHDHIDKLKKEQAVVCE